MTTPTYAIAHGSAAVRAARIIAGVARDNDKCKTCGVPYGDIPFEHCTEHSAYEAAHPMPNMTDDEAFEIAYSDAMDSNF